MKKEFIKKISIFFVLSLLLTLNFSCNNDDTPFITQEQERTELNSKYEEIILLANKKCVEAGDWSFTAIGSTPCETVVKYIPYPLTINTSSFLQKVSEYTAAEKRFNTKWELNKDCVSPESIPEPKSVMCKDGEPELVYE